MVEEKKSARRRLHTRTGTLSVADTHTPKINTPFFDGRQTSLAHNGGVQAAQIRLRSTTRQAATLTRVAHTQNGR